MDHICLPRRRVGVRRLVDSRDINNHNIQLGATNQMSCEEYVKLIASEMLPYSDDPFMYDYSWQGEQAYKTGIYSDRRAKFVAYRQHYAYFYKDRFSRDGESAIISIRKPRTGEAPLLRRSLFLLTRIIGRGSSLPTE